MYRKQIGTVGVDSGTIMVVDPCYVLSHDGSTITKTYNDMLNTFYPEGQDERDAPNSVEPWGEGHGVCTGTLYGDGTYPVYAEFEEGSTRPSRIVIDFDPWDED